MIIDFHTHTYPDKIAAKTVELLTSKSHTKEATDGTANGLRASMAEAGVDVSVILPVATSPRQTTRINEVAADMVANFNGNGLWSFGGIHPDNEDYKDVLKFVKDAGLKGIKLHPDYQAATFNDIRNKRIVDYASELGLITVVHAGIDIGLPDFTHCSPDMVLEVMRDVNPEKLVLAHMGGWNMWDEVLDKLCGLNVYFDTAFSYGTIPWQEDAEKVYTMLTTEQFVDIVKAHGEDKILFGTDNPWSNQKLEVANMKSLPLPESTINKILGGNAAGLLGL